MLLLDRKSFAAAARRDGTNRVQLRLRADGHLVELPFGKVTIGSSPRCNVRIEKPGIEPVHCLIVHGAEGLSVRRWAADTRLNGVPFDDAPLAEGDCLELAGVELELVSSQLTAMQPVGEKSAEWAPEPTTGDELLDTMQESVDAMAGMDTAPTVDKVAILEPVAACESAAESEPELPGTTALDAADAAEYVFRELQAACANSRSRSRKLLAALRSKQESYDALVERFIKIDQQLAEDNRRRAEWEQARSNHEVERRDWELQLREMREQVGEWENQLADQSQLIAELQQELAAAQIKESRSAIPGEADDDANSSPSSPQVLDWLPASTPPQSPADGSAKNLPPSTSREDSVDQQPIEDAKPFSASLRESASTWDSATAHEERAESDDFRTQSSPERQSTWAVESTTPATKANEGKVSAVTADEHPFAGLSNWKQSTARLVPNHEEPDVSAPTKSVATASILGIATFGEAASESADSVLTAPSGVVAPPAAQPNSWAAPADVSSSEVAPVAPPKAQPTSFIERSSHMFAEESADKTAPWTPIPQPAATVTAKVRPLTMDIARNAATEPNSSASNDEESIEQYMAKLLERVRGDGPPRAASQAPPPQQVTPEAASAGKSMSLEHLAPAEPAEREPMSEAEATEELATWHANDRKTASPTSATDMGALRALANQTARSAIGRHQLTKHRRDAVTKVIVSVLAGTTSLWLMLHASNWRDIQFIAACVSLIAAAYWAGEAFRSLLESMRAAAYDGPEDDSHESDSGYHPPMPIDVEDRF